MPNLTILKGLPGSGKSTWAFEEMRLTGNTVRVNRDELRPMLHGDAKWSGGREKLTVAAETAIVKQLLMNGTNVIVDDTNLLGAGVVRWQELFVQTGTVELRTNVNDFTDVSIAECIRRDSLRSGKARVGRGVIERMALTASLIDMSKYDKVAIVDVDGTLSDLDHRLHYLNETPKNYDGFYTDVYKDGRFESIWKAVWSLKDSGHMIVILSGRPTTVGFETDMWLSGLAPDHLFMRQGGDHRPDTEVKSQLMHSMFEAGLQKAAIKIIIDDRDSVCAVWREMDLPLVQVDHGAAISIHPKALELATQIRIPIRYADEAAKV